VDFLKCLHTLFLQDGSFSKGVDGMPQGVEGRIAISGYSWVIEISQMGLKGRAVDDPEM
jgi:hypothetical protein